MGGWGVGRGGALRCQWQPNKLPMKVTQRRTSQEIAAIERCMLLQGAAEHLGGGVDGQPLALLGAEFPQPPAEHLQGRLGMEQQLFAREEACKCRACPCMCVSRLGKARSPQAGARRPAPCFVGLKQPWLACMFSSRRSCWLPSGMTSLPARHSVSVGSLVRKSVSYVRAARVAGVG